VQPGVAAERDEVLVDIVDDFEPADRFREKYRAATEERLNIGRVLGINGRIYFSRRVFPPGRL